MTDVLHELGSTPLLRLFPNWSTSPKYSFLNALRIIEFEGTPQDFYEISPRKPQTFQAEILLETKTDEKNFLDFWKARKGRLEKFWLPVFPSLFTLKTQIETYTTILEVEPAPIEFDSERIYIYTSNDDLWVHKIVAYNHLEAKSELTLSSQADIQISLTDIEYFGLLVLCRFNKDSLDLAYESGEASKATMEVIEVMEYSEV